MAGRFVSFCLSTGLVGAFVGGAMTPVPPGYRNGVFEPGAAFFNGIAVGRSLVSLPGQALSDHSTSSDGKNFATAINAVLTIGGIPFVVGTGVGALIVDAGNILVTDPPRRPPGRSDNFNSQQTLG